MHRITLNIDLEANDLLEKEVVEAIKAETKRLTRERVDKIINDSISKVLDDRTRQWANMDWETRLKLQNMIDKNIKDSLEKFNFGISMEEVDKRLEARLESVDSLSKLKLRNMDRQIESTIEAKVKEYFDKYTYGLLVDMAKKEMNKGRA